MALSHSIDRLPVPQPLQFIAPRSAIEAIDVGAIIREATEDGVARPQIDLSPFETHVGWTRVTCPAEMTLRMVSAWRDAAGRMTIDEEGEERLAILRMAAVAAYKAYEQVRGRPRFRDRRRD